MRGQLLLQLSTVVEELNAARAKAMELKIAMRPFIDAQRVSGSNQISESAAIGAIVREMAAAYMQGERLRRRAYLYRDNGF